LISESGVPISSRVAGSDRLESFNHFPAEKPAIRTLSDLEFPRFDNALRSHDDGYDKKDVYPRSRRLARRLVLPSYRRSAAQDGARGFTPTHTGVGERAHEADENITLETHIRDVAGCIEAEEISDIILVGHSYGAW